MTAHAGKLTNDSSVRAEDKTGWGGQAREGGDQGQRYELRVGGKTRQAGEEGQDDLGNTSI